MWASNHILAYFWKALRTFEQRSESREDAIKSAEQYLKKNVATLILPDVLQMYAPKRQFHFCENPDGEISTIMFTTFPNSLKGIQKKYTADLKPSPTGCAMRGTCHPEAFLLLNPTWGTTAYMPHLYQDCVFDKWLNELVDSSERLSDKITYRNTGKVIDGSTFQNQIRLINEVVFKKLCRRIYEEFEIRIDQNWFEKKVYSQMLQEYDTNIAKEAWKIIKFPRIKGKVILPEFVTEEEIDVFVLRIVTSTYLNFNRG